MSAHAGRITRFLGDQIAAGVFPGAVFLVADGRRVVAEGALGLAVATPEKLAATLATIYDLASLTKPLAGALVAARLQHAGRLNLGDRLARHLGEWARAADRDVTLLDLLAHRSGLPAWAPLFLHAPDGDATARVAWLRQTPLAYPAGTGVAYSDLGYILLGFALERVGGAPLDRLLHSLVLEPLGVADLLYRPDAALKPRIAATEAGNARERALAGAEGDRYNGWRSEVLWGEVHDTNARALGGVSAHAGLFGTARAVHAVAVEFLARREGFLDPEGWRAFRTNLTPGLEEARTAGFQLAGSKASGAGTALSASSFGHGGFTGTSLWIDPEADRIHILLTNRVHPRHQAVDMNAVRREFHALTAAL